MPAAASSPATPRSTTLLVDTTAHRLRRTEEEMADMSLSEARREKAMNRYPRLEAELEAAGLTW